MNSKKKNKNRQNKPPNPNPPQKQDVSEPSSPQNVINTEIESVIEERVPNIVSENVGPEVKEIEESPKKPKRNRGKKKKEDENTDKEDEVKVEESLLDSEVQPNTQDDANIAPTARKKKNKNKKAQALVQEEKTEEIKIEDIAQLDEVSGQPQEEPVTKKDDSEQDMKVAKKKNKKKKNRNDSEKSEKAEDISCTSAFQKLLSEDVKVETVTQPSIDDSSISKPMAKEVEIELQPNIPSDIKLEETSEKDEGNKNKKKNKKDKKQQAAQVSPKGEEQKKSSDAVTPACNISELSSQGITEETKTREEPVLSTPSTSTTGNDSLKNKATIAKPVDKKKKGKDNLEKPASEAKSASVEEMKATEIKPTQSPPTREASPTEDLDDLILVPLTEITPDWQEEVKIEEGNGPVIGCEDKNETIVLEQPVRNHEKSKKRKKSPKPQTSTDIPKVSSTLQEGLPEVGCSSKDQINLKHDEKFDDKVELKPENKLMEQETRIKNTQIPKDKRKKSPKPSTCNESASATENPIEAPSLICKLDEVIPETSGKSPEHQEILFEEKLDEKLLHEAKEVESKTKNAQLQVADRDKRKNRKKSPKLETETSSVVPFDAIPESSHIGETMLATQPSCFDVVTPKPEEMSQIKATVDFEKSESDKEVVMERIQTPDIEKRQKRKKSPKPSVNLDHAAIPKNTQDLSQNILKTEDIIIIQAEVVNDDKAQLGETYIACEDSSNQKHRPKMEATQRSDKSQMRKKSPKPPQRKNMQDKKDHSEKDSAETQGQVQTPVTPIISQDMKLSPQALAVELETVKKEPLPSPNEVTPDLIEYPRCSSEQLDKNNNMVIQEIQHPDPHLEVPLVIPETPFIQSTNIESPETYKVESKAEEKSDLKSKVMEVNQDMEELRMSIERSLAELTSLEKTSEDAEIKIQTQNKENLEKSLECEATQKMPVIDFSSLVSNQSVEPPIENKGISDHAESEIKSCQGPVCPARKDAKGKGKSKKKGKQESTTQNTPTCAAVSTAGTEGSTQPQDKNKDTSNKPEQSTDTRGKEKQQKSESKENKDDDLHINENNDNNSQPEFQPIENFEDAMTSSVDDVNKTFELIVNEAETRLSGTQNNPEINVIAPQEDAKGSRQEKQNPVSPPKNLLGHPDIPVPSSRTDYKKEKNKPPNSRQAKVKIKDANQVNIEMPEKTKESESKTKLNFKNPDESICVTNQNDDYVYKYSFRKVFLQCSCHVCKKDLNQTRVPCGYCNLIFYCNQKHKDEDYPQHQALCFAVSTIVHLKDQKFIYADARNVTGHNYRLLRMQMIVSCEKVLKRKLVPWEQEALLYPRMCADPSCREWRQGKLMDCEGCGQTSYCSEHPDHLPKSHSRWCKSYNLYRGLVKHQQTKGRLEPKLPTRVVELSPLPDNINEVLAAMYEEKIEMSDIEYAALTQLATAPLTALFCLQHRTNNANGIVKKQSLTLHIVGAELQFEADVLNKWEVFLLHLLPHVEELRVILVGPDLNPSNLPLELLGKIKYCDHCQRNKRRVIFGFQDKRNYHEFWASEDFTAPDLVCAFNPSIQRSSAYNGKDTWPATINCIFKLKIPFAITSYTLSELTSDLLRVQECATVGYNVLCAPRNNSFSSVRPDRNFISDDEAPLLFKNHCVTVVCGV